MKKLIIALMLVCLLPLTVLIAESEDDQIRRLMDMTGSGDLGVMMLDSMISQFESVFPEVPSEYWLVVRDEFQADELVERIIPIYRKYFSQQDIADLIGFYESPVGRKLSSNLPMILQDSMNVGELWGNEIAERVLYRLQDDGLITE